MAAGVPPNCFERITGVRDPATPGFMTPPTTPRHQGSQRPDRRTLATPPATPQQRPPPQHSADRCRERCGTPPPALRRPMLVTPPSSPCGGRGGRTTPPPTRKAAGRPPLLRALQANSIQMAQRVLKADPDAAAGLSWDDSMREPPLCAAVRLKCGAELVQLLMEHGADPRLVNREGRAPLNLLVECWRPVEVNTLMDFPELGIHRVAPPSGEARCLKNVLAVAGVFARFGVDPGSPDATGLSPLGLAEAVGSTALVTYWHHLQALKVMRVLRRSLASGHGDLAVLPSCLLAKLEAFLNHGTASLQCLEEAGPLPGLADKPKLILV
uniref:Uncharacterized protein n=1 Tax=Alexandrium monilatum TaxID=311494 RepID=A0A7S4QYZ4_9DINO